MRGLLLSGGGSRAAYQVGVLRCIQEISREPGGKVPFEILAGTSAGAINMAALAGFAGDFRAACNLLENQWKGLSTGRVFHTETFRIARNAWRWSMDLVSGGASLGKDPRARALVDTAPLAELITSLLPRGAIARNVGRGLLEAAAVSAVNYETGSLTTFVQGRGDQTLWRRFSRVARYDQIEAAHILASCALPILFPAIRIGNSYFGDGSVRNMAPLSPAIHLGARKILAIGARELLKGPQPRPPDGDEPRYPSPAQISGLLLDSIFLDALESDCEQMNRINRVLEALPKDPAAHRRLRLEPIQFLYLGPTKPLAELAGKHRGELPRSVRYMLAGLGAKGAAGGELLSYLLFESGFCCELIDLGYRDAAARTDEIRNFLWP